MVGDGSETFVPPCFCWQTAFPLLPTCKTCIFTYMHSSEGLPACFGSGFGLVAWLQRVAGSLGLVRMFDASRPGGMPLEHLQLCGCLVAAAGHPWVLGVMLVPGRCFPVLCSLPGSPKPFGPPLLMQSLPHRASVMETNFFFKAGNFKHFGSPSSSLHPLPFSQLTRLRTG